MGATCGCCGSEKTDYSDCNIVSRKEMLAETLSNATFELSDISDIGSEGKENGNESDTLFPLKISKSNSRPLGLVNTATVQPDNEWYEGDLVMYNGIKWIRYYGILFDTTLNLYRQQPSIMDIMKHKNIYDMINISQFYDIKEYKLDTFDEYVSVSGDNKIYTHGISFADPCGKFDIERVLFEQEKDRHDWYKRFKLVMIIDQNIINENKTKKPLERSHTTIECLLHSGWILYGRSALYWMELMENSSELLLYKDNKNEKDKKVLRYIDLIHHEHVKSVDNPDRNTRFRYGLKIDGITLFLKSINDRAKWVTHCEFIVKQTNNKSNKNAQ